MRLLDLLPPERVHANVEAPDKAALIKLLANQLAPAGQADSVHAAIEARERLGSTGLGKGVAIPHGRCALINEASATFIRLRHPLDFGASDHQPVDLIAALIVPDHFADQHLKLLSELAILFSNSQITAALRAAPDASSLYNTLIEWGGTAA